MEIIVEGLGTLSFSQLW